MSINVEAERLVVHVATQRGKVSEPNYSIVKFFSNEIANLFK